jgi:hypothetical protein
MRDGIKMKKEPARHLQKEGLRFSTPKYQTPVSQRLL